MATIVKAKSPYNNVRWKARSRAFLAKTVWCEMWLSLGRHVLAEATDHIITHTEGGAFWLEDNWMPLSNFWHGKKSVLEQNNRLNLKVKETKHGKVPVNRNEVIRVLTKVYAKDIKEWQEGQRS